MSRPIDATKKENRSCIICGKIFKVYKHTKKKFCSTICSSRYQMKRSYKNCLTCKKEFFVRPHTIKNGYGKYCSQKCYIQKEGEDRKCLICNKTFYAVPKAIKENGGKYCSPFCFYSQNIKDKNPAWKGGTTSENQSIRQSPLYANWRKKVFERDRYTCIWCGVVGGNLQADHIKPFADFPDLRFELDNGRTLCVSCHRKTETWGYNYWINNRRKEVLHEQK